MPTEENQTTWVSTSSAWSSQTSSLSTQWDNDNLNPSDKIDNLDIDLNLDGVVLPPEQPINNNVWETDNLNLADIDLNKISNESEQINFSDIDFSFDSAKEVNIDDNSNQIDVSLAEVDTIPEINTNVEENKVEDDWLLAEDKKVEELLPIVDEQDVNIGNKPGLLDEEKAWDVLDIPFVWPTEDVIVDSNEKKLNDLWDIFGNENDTETQPSFSSEPEIKTENQNIENISKEPVVEDVQNDELLVEDLGESVVENKEWDIVSDTGEFNWNSNGYVPNEHDFNQITEILDSSTKWPIDMSSLDNVKENKQELDLWNNVNNISSQKMNNWIDLDSMISTLDTSKNVVEDLVINAPVSTLLDTKVLNSDQASLETVQNWIDSNINTNLDLNVQPVDPSLNNQQLVDKQVNVISAEEFLKKKRNHSGIKVFILIVLLLVGWFMILSKMYPEEIRDIVDAIQNGNQTSIEYSDNADIWVILDETEESLSGDISEEELDPDSLAAQLENGDEDMLWSGIDYSEEDISTQHGSSNDTDLNAFETLDDVIGSDSASLNNDWLLDSLNVYITKWTEFNDWGRSIWNSTAMKYGTYIFTKASAVVNDIENGVEIDNTKVENYFAQFDIYLDKLSNLRNSTEWAVQEEPLSLQPVDESISEQPISTEF